MARIEIDGVGRVEVADSFRDLPPAAQMAAVKEITAAKAAQGSSGGVAATALDAAKSGGIGLAKGVIGLPGALGDMRNLALSAGEKVASMLGVSQDRIDEMRPVAEAIAKTVPMLGGPTSGEIQKTVEGYTGDFYKPKTTTGKYTQTVAEFVPGALGPGGVGRNVANLLKFAVAPGLAAEKAGQLTEGSAAEPYARAGAALLTGGAAAALTRPRTASSAVRGAIPDGITPAQLDAAEQLFNDAQRLGHPITRAEAVQAVSGGATRLGDLQRVVEGQGELKPFFAQRPAQNEAAFGRVVNQVDPTPTPQPSTIGPEVGAAAEGTITDVRGAINNATRPLYDAATSQTIAPNLFDLIRNDPVFVEGVRRVRDDPIIGPTLRGMPDNSVAVVDAVKKQLDETGRNLRDPLAGTARNNYAASIVDEGTRGIVSAADIATGSRPGAGAMGAYEAARALQTELRQRYLEPLLQGPLGRLAKSDMTTQRAIEALFPQNPLPNSADEVTIAVTALAHRNPLAARRLVRAHMESVFNESVQNNIPGPNEFGGAKFAAAIRGNPQQAANLEAAVRALPNGDIIWPGMNRFLEVVEAQGTRQRIGSQTAFNQEVLQDLRRGTTVQEVGAAVATVGVKLPAKIKDTLERWRLGRGAEEIASLLTNPEAGARFRQIAVMPQGSADAARVFARLVYLAGEGARSSSQSK